MKFFIRLLLGVLLVGGLLALLACSDLGYYQQAVSGQFDLLSRRQPIPKLLDDPATPKTLKKELRIALQIREFASKELALPENGSYRSYADLQRSWVVWNVVATPEFSLKPVKWCFPIAGCVTYRGYFSRLEGKAFAEKLRHRGDDVCFYEVSAYSTLGWFDDPVLNTFFKRSLPDLAGLIFHELAHQKLYVKGDSFFNEAFAKTVEMAGVVRWLKETGRSQMLSDYLLEQRRHSEFGTLVLNTRKKLATLYASGAAPAAMRAEKARIFDGMRQAYRQLKREWGGYDGYDWWFDRHLNNADLASVSTYRHYVPAFRALLRKHHGDFRAFYREAAEIGHMPFTQRTARLEKLLTIALSTGTDRRQVLKTTKR